MLNCREVVTDADLLLAGDLSWQHRIKIKIHLMLCRHCRRYVHQLKILIEAIPFIHRQASEEEVSHVIDRINCSEN